MLDGGGDVGDLGDGAVELVDVLNESLDVANGDGAIDAEIATHDTDSHVAKIGKDMSDGKSERPEELGFPGGFIELVVTGFEVGVGGGGVSIDFDDLLAGIVLFNDRIDGAKMGTLIAEMILGAGHDSAHDN